MLVTHPDGFIGRISTVKIRAKVFFPDPTPRANSRLFAGVAAIHGAFGYTDPRRESQLNEADGVTPSSVL